jgi:hypothetical protein
VRAKTYIPQNRQLLLALDFGDVLFTRAHPFTIFVWYSTLDKFAFLVPSFVSVSNKKDLSFATLYPFFFFLVFGLGVEGETREISAFFESRE